MNIVNDKRSKYSTHVNSSLPPPSVAHNPMILITNLFIIIIGPLVIMGLLVSSCGQERPDNVDVALLAGPHEGRAAAKLKNATHKALLTL